MKRRGHRVAWFILVALGLVKASERAMDPGSNPGGPIIVHIGGNTLFAIKNLKYIICISKFSYVKLLRLLKRDNESTMYLQKGYINF